MAQLDSKKHLAMTQASAVKMGVACLLFDGRGDRSANCGEKRRENGEKRRENEGKLILMMIVE